MSAAPSIANFAIEGPTVHCDRRSDLSIHDRPDVSPDLINLLVRHYSAPGGHLIAPVAYRTVEFRTIGRGETLKIGELAGAYELITMTGRAVRAVDGLARFDLCPVRQWFLRQSGGCEPN